MPKTALELLNKVGRHLRRSSPKNPYTSLDQDANAVFVFEMINEAKRMVEAERHWHLLRQTLFFNSVPFVTEYDLSDPAVIEAGSNPLNRRSRITADRFRRPQFWDISDDEFRLRRNTREIVLDRQLFTENSQRRITEFAMYPSVNGLEIMFPWDPSESRRYRGEFTVPQADLELPDDEMLIYEDPVIYAAVALASEERGEELGVVSATWWERYDNALSEAIVVDSDPTDYELFWD